MAGQIPHTRKSGGRVSVGGGRGDLLLNVRFKIEGVERTSDEFKRIRRDINGRVRDTMVRVGERDLLPPIRREFPRLRATTSRGLTAGKMGDSLAIQRERSGVFVYSRLRTAENRALGWIDFGGRRRRDTVTRRGPKVILTNVDARRDLIDKRVLEAVMDEFKDFT